MNRLKMKEQLSSFFFEDIGYGDLTTEAIFKDEQGLALFRSKDHGIFCGGDIISAAYELIDPSVKVKMYKQDGDLIDVGDVLCEVSGPAVALLSSERVILNVIQRLSGIATQTNRAVLQVLGTNIRICDTRKTTPGLRMLEKYAVKCGGGYNHRFGLDDAVLIKDNHIAQCGGSLEEAIRRVREQIAHMVKIEVEVETKAQVIEAVKQPVDVIMFDNCTPNEARDWRSLVPDSIPVELSGGITIDQLKDYADTGVDYISIGALTHSVKALDISLDVKVKEGVEYA